eukprot:949383-Amphidinium_carterae.1
MEKDHGQQRQQPQKQRRPSRRRDDKDQEQERSLSAGRRPDQRFSTKTMKPGTSRVIQGAAQQVAFDQDSSVDSDELVRGKVLEPSPDQVLDELLAAKAAREQAQSLQHSRLALRPAPAPAAVPVQAAAPAMSIGMPNEWKDDILRALGGLLQQQHADT